MAGASTADGTVRLGGGGGGLKSNQQIILDC